MRKSVELHGDMAGYGDYLNKTHCRKLWELVSRWNSHLYVKGLVYRYVWADDETKAATFRSCEEAAWRRAILQNCGAHDERTLALGLRDEDDQCRSIAYSKVGLLEPKEYEALLEGEDDWALAGLGANSTVPLVYLVRIEARLHELRDDPSALRTRRTIERVRRLRAPESVEELFSQDTPKRVFLEDKLNAVGRVVVSLKGAADRTAAIVRRVIVWLAVAGGALIIFRTWQ